VLVKKIKKGVETLNNTVTKLLNYTRFNELNRMETDYVQFIKSSLEQFRHQQENSCRNTVIALNENNLSKPGDVITFIDKLLFRQCLFNVLTNSIEAGGEKARINISLSINSSSNLPAHLANKINLDYDESILVTTISDNGPGIRPENRDKIFAPFFTTKSSGSGLGLAVAWKLIKAHGGDIFLGETSGPGATFHILLPARLGGTQLENYL
jgi:signal transduction histidine kinase